MPKVSEEHKEEMRRRIASAALETFVAKGFSGASMADIVAAAGVSAGAVYLYYRSKAELLVAAARMALSDRFAILEEASLHAPVDAPDVVIPRILASLSSEKQLPSMVIQVWGESVHNAELGRVAREVLGNATGNVAAYLQAWFEQGGMSVTDAAERGAALAPAMLGLVQANMLRLAILGDEGLEDYADSVRELLGSIRP